MRMWIRAALGAIAALAVAMPSQAQDAPEYLEVTQLTLAPADADAFLDMVQTVREAAEEIDMDPRFAWDTYRWDNTIFFVSWHESLVNFEDPEAFVRAFQGTSAESKVMRAFEGATNMRVISGLNEVQRIREDLSYMPADPAVAPGEQAGAYVVRQWPIGDPAEFEESFKDFMGMLTEIGGVYPVYVSQNVIGKGGYTLAVMFDNPSSFFGENALAGMVERAGLSEQWEQQGDAHSQLISDTETRMVWYLPEHSYRPDDM